MLPLWGNLLCRKLGALLMQAQLLLFDLDYQKGDQCKLLLGYLFKVA
jgi:hypothetical protein